MGNDIYHGYKAFKKGMICEPDKDHVKQYKENEIFEEDGGEICNSGMMHYCVDPMDLLRFYPPVCDKNGELIEYAKVEALEEPVTDDGGKYATKKLKIYNKITFKELIEYHVKNKIDNSGSSQTRYRSGSSQTGPYSGSSQTGPYSGSSQTRHCSGSSQTGPYSGSSQTGSFCSSIQKGAFSASLSTGEYCSHNAAGKNCIAVCWGEGSRAKGSIGSYLVLSEWKDGDFIGAQMVRVDGETIKADTFYMMKDGKVVEYNE